MFVKTTVKKVGDKTYRYKHLVRSYRDEQGVPRHEYLLNLSQFPAKITRRIEGALDEETVLVNKDSLQVENGDCLRGGGQLALWRAWEVANFPHILSSLTPKQRQSTQAMVLARITDPSSKRALKERIADTFLSRLFSKNRLDEDTLYEVMDTLYEHFYSIQEKLRSTNHQQDTVLLLYDTTSTYFEGRCAQPGEHGHSKDKRWDRYQIIIGLVANQEGMPLAVEVWPGNTHDADTVNDRIEHLRHTFHIQKAIFVSDSGTYSQENMEHISEAGYDYIASLAWRKQKKKLEELAPKQLNLFDQRGYYQWQEQDKRFVGCHSESEKIRQRNRRQRAMKKAQEKLDDLKKTARKGRYYHKLRLYEKATGILKKLGVNDIFCLEIKPLEEIDSDKEKCRLELNWEVDMIALKQRKDLEGKYILETSLTGEEKTPADIENSYKELQKVERGFRHIKSFLAIRPIYHRLERRIKAHVLICFLAYYLVKWMEINLRANGEGKEVERVIDIWDRLKLVKNKLKVGDMVIEQYNWSRGRLGEEVIQEMKRVGWWRSIQAYKCSVTKKIESQE